jgi:hypothetical protein
MHKHFKFITISAKEFSNTKFHSNALLINIKCKKSTLNNKRKKYWNHSLKNNEGVGMMHFSRNCKQWGEDIFVNLVRF